MRVISQLLDCIHLDPGYALLSVQNCLSCIEIFHMMDIHNNASMNDWQFFQFLRVFSDLNRSQSDTLFQLLDIDHSGEVEFEEFYLVYCMLIACKDQYEKEFIYRHSSSIFALIDADTSGLINAPEFNQMGVLFNFDYNSIHSIFDEFDVSGDKNLDFAEFRLFTMACIDEQRSADANNRVSALSKYHVRCLRTLEFLIRMYTVTQERDTGYFNDMALQKLPMPRDVDKALKKVSGPTIYQKQRRSGFIDWAFIRSKLSCQGLGPRVKALQKWFWTVIRFLCCCFCISATKHALKDLFYKCCGKIRRRMYRSRIHKARLPYNMNTTIKIKREQHRKLELRRKRGKKDGKVSCRKCFQRFRKRNRRIQQAPPENSQHEIQTELGSIVESKRQIEGMEDVKVPSKP